MIDCPGLTSAFFEEARLFAERMRFNEESHTEGSDTEEKFARLMASSPLPSSAQLCSVIEEVFWASLLTEEGRPCRPRLLYSPGREQVRPSVHQLARSVPLTRETLRKLAPVQGSLGYLAWDYGSGGMEITGVQGREGGDPGNLIIAAPKNGALDISWSCARLLALRAGQLARLSQSRLPEVLRALEFVGRLTGSIEPAFLGSVIRAIASAGHGGAVWVLREGSASDGLHIGYPIQSDQRPLPQNFEMRKNWLASLGYLAGADGAVLIDSRLKVLGFGAFINIPDSPRYVAMLSYGGEVTQIESTALGGGRHRSAVEFCSRFAPSAAIVVSEDGRITMAWAAAPNTPWFAPFSALGQLTDFIID